MVKRLILFVHGLGGSDDTWGEFPTLLKNDNAFSSFDVKSYSYRSKIVRNKNIVALFSKVFAFITPQQRLPKIQDVADLLKTEIEERYAAYEEIYLVTHSMGGLVARKYLYEMVKSKTPLQVKKLMLYAVPNNGSDWAKLASFYKHEQIEQLNRESDFMQHLNKEVDNIELEKALKVLYVVGKYDDVVDESSARGYWGNKSVKSLPNTHTDIVKPKDADDLSFLVLKNFLTSKENVDETHEKPITSQTLTSSFANATYDTLSSDRLVVCYHQDHVDVAYEQEALKQKLQGSFQEHFYHVEVPSDESNEAEYFQKLSNAIDGQGSVKSSNKWKTQMKKRLNGTHARVVFLFTNIANGNEALNVKMAKAIRSLKTDHQNFYALCVGRKDLAYLVHGNRTLSPLNTATELFFPMNDVSLSEYQVVQTLKGLKENKESICDCLETSWSESWSTWSYEKGINELFWKSILVNSNGKYTWRKSSYRGIAKEVLGC